MKSEDYGKHLLGVQDLIQKHTLSETDITTQTEWAKTLKTQAQKFVEEKHPDSAKITSKANELDAACERLHTHSKHRLSMLQVRKDLCFISPRSIIISGGFRGVSKVRPNPPFGWNKY